MKTSGQIRNFQSVFKSSLVVFFIIINFLFTAGQETSRGVSGRVWSIKNVVLPNANVKIVHTSTNNYYLATTNSMGYFYFFNLKPGGPYTIIISYSGYDDLEIKDLYLDYSEDGFFSRKNVEVVTEFILKEKHIVLKSLSIHAVSFKSLSDRELAVNKKMIEYLPSINRNFQDIIRLSPTANTNGEGMISLAGQNNKFNAVYIDGANANDMLGISVSGTAGGQSGTSPISLEAIEAIKVAYSPYNVQYSNFTGASINAITKSGDNTCKSAAWYYFRNQQMAGKLPQSSSPADSGIKRWSGLPHFTNQTSGVWTSGAFKKDRLFYFFLFETQHETEPQVFDAFKLGLMADKIFALADFLRKSYEYEPGTFAQINNELKANRLNLKLDWNQGVKNKFTFSYRFNGADRVKPQQQNSNTVIRFSNNRYKLISNTNAVSFEWRNYLKHSAVNRLLFVLNSEITSRNIVRKAFPFVSVKEGNITIGFGSNATGHLSGFKASEFSLLDVLSFAKKDHSFTLGAEINYSTINDLAMGGYFGIYRYGSIDDFINNAKPSLYFRTVFRENRANGKYNGATTFNNLRTSVFFSEELNLNQNLKLTAGIRIDGNSIPSTFIPDSFFDSVARPAIGKYYLIDDVRIGTAMQTNWSFSPRFGFKSYFSGKKILLQGGAGIFSGRILNLWTSEVYRVNSYSINVYPQATSQGIVFNPDPYNQPGLQSLGIDPLKERGDIVLFDKNYKYPSVFRTTFNIEKTLSRNWKVGTELLVTKNIYENKYTNVNLVPPSLYSSLPNRRNIYSLSATPGFITMPGGNPYENIIILGNNRQDKGYAWGSNVSVTGTIHKNWFINLGYGYLESYALFDPNGNSNTNIDQWESLETTNGKNYAARSISDFDLRHRINATLIKKITYGRNSTVLTLFYNGQSGRPYSYTYLGSMINDNGRNENYDLIYVPTRKDVEAMIFIPNTIDNVIYSGESQKILFNDYIESDRYLNKRRGKFAERNGGRLPFTHIVDLRIQQNFSLKTNKRKEIRFSLTYDVFNFTNMLNRKWGRIYFLTNDNYQLIKFAGFSNSSTATPQYQFTPQTSKPWTLQTSTAPGSSARWISQLGLKISFN